MLMCEFKSTCMLEKVPLNPTILSREDDVTTAFVNEPSQLASSKLDCPARFNATLANELRFICTEIALLWVTVPLIANVCPGPPPTDREAPWTLTPWMVPPHMAMLTMAAALTETCASENDIAVKVTTAPLLNCTASLMTYLEVLSNDKDDVASAQVKPATLPVQLVVKRPAPDVTEIDAASNTLFASVSCATSPRSSIAPVIVIAELAEGLANTVDAVCRSWLHTPSLRDR